MEKLVYMLDEMRDLKDDINSAIKALQDLDNYYVERELGVEKDKIAIGRMLLESIYPKIEKIVKNLDRYIVENG